MSRAPRNIAAPQAISADHLVESFDCGEPSLDDWLRKRALANEVSGASRTFVLCDGREVVGYYALAAGAIASSAAPGRLRRNMPDPIPVFILGRLAVDRRHQSAGFGSLLLRDAVLRTHDAARSGGIAGIAVHALSDEAKRFYERRGFVESPSNPMTLIARMKDIAALLG